MGKKGSVLAITTGFVISFTLIGFAAIYMTDLESMRSQKQVSSTKAFWLAEAGIEQAFGLLPGSRLNTSTTTPPELNGGTYDVTTSFKNILDESGNIIYTFTQRWIINASGNFTPAVERIQAEVGINIINAFQTTGTLKSGSEDQIKGTYTENNPYPFAYYDIFHKTPEQTKSIAQILTSPKNNPDTTDAEIPLQNGVIWVDGDLKISNASWNYKGILIVNGKFEMTGGSFQGVLWVNGPAKMIEGNPGVDGAVFINDPKTGETKIDSSSAWIKYDERVIDEAFGYIPGGAPPESYHHLIRWQQI